MLKQAKLKCKNLIVDHHGKIPKEQRDWLERNDSVIVLETLLHAHQLILYAAEVKAKINKLILHFDMPAIYHPDRKIRQSASAIQEEIKLIIRARNNGIPQVYVFEELQRAVELVTASPKTARTFSGDQCEVKIKEIGIFEFVYMRTDPDLTALAA